MEYCKECGAKLVRYWHKLNKPLCQSMVKLFEYHQLNEGKIANLLTHNQLCNFQKLKYWNFVTKGEIESSKGGFWKLTHKGFEFITGKIKVPDRIQTYRSIPVGYSLKQVGISDIIEGYQYKFEYILDAEGHITNQKTLSKQNYC